MSKKIKGKLTIVRQTSNVDSQNNLICITIKDEESALEIAEIQIDPRVFAITLTGLSAQECKVEIGDVFDKIGKKLVLKNIEVTPTLEEFNWISKYDNRNKINEIAAIFEYYLRFQLDEGWVLDRYFNGRDFVNRDNQSFRITMRRYEELPS